MNAVAIPANALVLIVDGAKVLFLRNVGSERQPELKVEQALEQHNPATRDQGTDKPGRLAADAGRGATSTGGRGAQARSAIEPTDWHSLEEARFAAQIAEDLYKAAHAGVFDDLVVVAPPATLGELRRQFHKELNDRIVAEVPRDLTGHMTAEIQRLLRHH